MKLKIIGIVLMSLLILNIVIMVEPVYAKTSSGSGFSGIIKLPRSPPPAPIGDISVTGGVVSSVIVPPSPIVINTNVMNSYSFSVTSNLRVVVTGYEGQPVYQAQSKSITIPANGEIKSSFSFDTTGWTEGAYHVMILFPIQIQLGEMNGNNNIVEFEIRVPRINKVDLALSGFYFTPYYASYDGYITYGDYYNIHYTIENKGNVVTTGIFEIKCLGGGTIYTSSITMNPGETKSQWLTLSSSKLPFVRSPTGNYVYTLTGTVKANDDLNLNNNVQKTYVYAHVAN